MKVGINMNRLGKLDQSVPVYSPRSTYKLLCDNDQDLLADLTLNFDRFTINLLKEEFRVRNWKMDLIQFICMVKQHFSSWKKQLVNRQVKLIRCLSKLFQQIDLNGNQILQWDQFTNYIIEKATSLKSLKSKADEIKAYTRSNVRPKLNLQQSVTKVIYIPSIERIAMFEEGSNIVHFMNPQNGVTPQKLIVQMTTVKKTKEGGKRPQKKDHIIPTSTQILDIAYISDSKYNLLLTSTSDGYVKGWRNNQSNFILATQPDNDQEIFQHKFSSQVYCLAWDSLNQMLYCGHEAGGITIWNLKTDTQKILSHKFDKSNMKNEIDLESSEIGHQELVTQMITMPKLQFMASGAMDGKLILWDTINNKKKHVYKEHKWGILTLTFNEALILLFSGGFDHQICIWNPYIPTIIHRIQSHSFPVICIKVIQGTNQVVSLDEQGNVKISDTRRFNLISSLSIESSDEKHKFKSQNFCYIERPLKLVFCGRSLCIYDYDKNYNPIAVDDCYAISCKYLKNMMCFFTPTGNKIKVWNALTGDIYKIFSDITTAQISYFGFDFLYKRMLIGDFSGKTGVYNITNGAKIKVLPQHKAQIVNVINIPYGRQYNILLTASLDNKINLIKDNDFGESQLIRTLQIGKQAVISCVKFCMKVKQIDQTKMIIVGTNIGYIGYYQMETGKLLGNTSDKSAHEEITSLQIMENIPFLISTNSQGKIYIIAMPPLLFKFQKIFSILNYDIQNPDLASPITCSIYEDRTQKLFIGEQQGSIKCYDFSSIEAELKETVSKNKLTNVKLLQCLQNEEISILWYTQAHAQSIKSIDIIPDDNILMTTSYDKRVKLWSSIDGKLIDSLMQNYDKKQPYPIALRKLGSTQIYKLNLVQRIDFNSPKEQELLSQFDPYHYFSMIDKRKCEFTESNKDWKLKIDFNQHYKERIKDTEKVLKQVAEKEKEYMEWSKKQKEVSSKFRKVKIVHQTNQQKTSKKAKLKIAQDFSNQVKQIGWISDKFLIRQKNIINSQTKKPDQFQSILSKSIALTKNKHSDIKQKRSISKSKNNIWKQYGIQTLDQMIKKKHKSKEQKLLEADFQKNYIERLYNRESKGKLVFKNQPKIRLDHEEYMKAERLSRALGEVNENDRITQKFVRNMMVRQNHLPRLK